MIQYAESKKLAFFVSRSNEKLIGILIAAISIYFVHLLISAYNCKLSEERFLCNDNSSCIPLNKVCDGKVDCPKGDDESSTCNFAKEECETNRCPKEAVCHSLPTGSVCICPEGYDFNATSEKCEVSVNLLSIK